MNLSQLGAKKKHAHYAMRGKTHEIQATIRFWLVHDWLKKQHVGSHWLDLEQPFTCTLPRVHTTPEEFENRTFFIRLGLPSTLIRHENEAFQKRSLNRRNLKTSRENILKTGLFENNGVTTTIWSWLPWPNFPQTNIQNDRWLVRFQISSAQLPALHRCKSFSLRGFRYR